MKAWLSNARSQGWTRPHVLILFALAALWAGENFFIQAAAFTDRFPGQTRAYELIRLGLNFLAAMALILVCRRRVLVAILAGDFLLALGLVAYAQYFHRGFSLRSSLHSLDEGFRARSFAIDLIPAGAWALLLAALVIKLLLVYRLEPRPLEFRRRAAALCLGLGLLTVLGLQRTNINFHAIATARVSRSVYAYGYLISWAAEGCFTPSNQAAEELIALQKESPDRLSALEPPWQFTNKIAIVQMESCGWNVLHYQINGDYVMPYLNSLSGNSHIFKIQAYHDMGSLDMDFAVLSDGRPSPRVISYMVPGISYSNCLPRFFHQYQFHTAAFHGGNGDFFDRQPAFARMGFDEIWFKENLTNLNVRQSTWGVRDAECFRLSSERMRQAGPEFHFIITLDSHGPFDLIDDDEKEIFPHSQVWQENYFNSMRVLDSDLRKYIESLPAGTLVILYGDHTSGVDYGDFHSARQGEAEFVPCIVHVCGRSLPPLAESESASLPPDLRLLDIINCMRHQVQRQDRPACSATKVAAQDATAAHQ